MRALSCDVTHLPPPTTTPSLPLPSTPAAAAAVPRPRAGSSSPCIGLARGAEPSPSAARGARPVGRTWSSSVWPFACRCCVWSGGPPPVRQPRGSTARRVEIHAGKRQCGRAEMHKAAMRQGRDARGKATGRQMHEGKRRMSSQLRRLIPYPCPFSVPRAPLFPVSSTAAALAGAAQGEAPRRRGEPVKGGPPSPPPRLPSDARPSGAPSFSTTLGLACTRARMHKSKYARAIYIATTASISCAVALRRPQPTCPPPRPPASRHSRRPMQTWAGS